MHEQYYKWYSPTLNRDFEMMTFGYAGYPVILFPTSMGRYFENKDQGLIESVRWFIENGLVKIYCPDSIDSMSWYNRSVHPAVRVHNHNIYDQMLREEIVPVATSTAGCSKIAVAGCSFGGFHASNFAFRHPGIVSHLYSMSGAFETKGLLDGFYNDDVYFNTPLDYLSGSNEGELWNMKIVLGIPEFDACKPDNERLSHILTSKNIDHWYDFRSNAIHDWPIWKVMFPHYLSLI